MKGGPALLSFNLGSQSAFSLLILDPFFSLSLVFPRFSEMGVDFFFLASVTGDLLG